MGMPVVEMLLRERMGCEVRPVMFTNGMGQSTDGRLWFVGKVDLMAGLRQALETGEMQIPKQVVDGVEASGAGGAVVLVRHGQGDWDDNDKFRGPGIEPAST